MQQVDKAEIRRVYVLVAVAVVVKSDRGKRLLAGAQRALLAADVNQSTSRYVRYVLICTAEAIRRIQIERTVAVKVGKDGRGGPWMPNR